MNIFSAPSGIDDPRLAEIVESIVDRAQAGEAVDIEECVREHPEHTNTLRQLLPALVALAELGRSASSDPTPVGVSGPDSGPVGGMLGDYRLIREVGRGGMGIVYEAEQISLGRRVALKVLPFAATMDPRHSQRFQNEARAAASLHHTNIVPVYGVGCERGVHYYAMQFIEGQSLAELLEELRGSSVSVANLPGRAAKSGPTAHDGRTTKPRTAQTVSSNTATTGMLSAERATNQKAYYQRVARLGIQAAQALDHAHQQGVVHRDIKPANLLLDRRGDVWIADFGLARLPTDAGLTMSGAMIGTLRYASPEQAMAKRAVTDHRTDIYSLGATLYELLTLRAVFSGNDRQELLRQIAFDDPVPPRSRTRGLPHDLETIVLKALAKEPAARYATADELVKDLQRFVDDQPIHAKRPCVTELIRKWGRRNRAAVTVAAVAVVTLIAMFGGVIGWTASRQSLRRTRLESDVTAYLTEADRIRKGIDSRLATPLQVSQLISNVEAWRATLAHARASWRQANDLAQANQDVVTPDLSERLEQMHAQLQLDESEWAIANKLDQIRLNAATLVNGHWNLSAAAAKYEQAFRDAGLDVRNMKAADAAAMIRQRALRYILVAALDHWANVSMSGTRAEIPHLLEVARLADPDPLRDRIRDYKVWTSAEELERLAKSVDATKNSPEILGLLGIQPQLQDKAAVELLRRAVLRHPQHFWLHFNLADKSTDPRDKIACYRAALAIRPRCAAAYHNLGNELHRIGAHVLALEHYQEALEIDPNFAWAHDAIADQWREMGNLAKALEHYQTAVKLDPNDAEIRNDYGIALYDMKDFEGAIRQYRKALALNPNLVAGHVNLGHALRDNKDLDTAITHYQKTLELYPDCAEAENGLGIAFKHKKDSDRAIQHYRRSLELDPRQAGVHFNLALALADKKQDAEAILHYQKAIDLDPHDYKPIYNLANGLYASGEFKNAISHYRKVLELKKDHVGATNNLANSLASNGQLDDAIVYWRKTVAIDSQFAGAHNNLGKALALKGDIDGSIQHYRQAADLGVKSATLHYNLANALKRKGNIEGAISNHRKAIEYDSGFAEAHCNLGALLKETGRFTEALACFRRGHALGSKRENWAYPSESWVRECERLVEMNEQLSSLLSGEFQPGNDDDWLSYIRISQMKKAFVTEIQLWRRFLEGVPFRGNQDGSYVFQASCRALMAADPEVKGTEPVSEAQRRANRLQALKWLHSELQSWVRRLESCSAITLVQFLRETGNWQASPKLALVRNGGLAELPHAERQSWKDFWSQVKVLREAVCAGVRETVFSGKLSEGQKRHSHEIKLRQFQTYFIDLRAVRLDRRIQVHVESADGKVLRPDSSGNIAFKPPATGTYYLVVGASEADAEYALIVREVLKDSMR